MNENKFNPTVHSFNIGDEAYTIQIHEETGYVNEHGERDDNHGETKKTFYHVFPEGANGAFDAPDWETNECVTFDEAVKFANQVRDEMIEFYQDTQNTDNDDEMPSNTDPERGQMLIIVAILLSIIAVVLL